MVGTPKRAEVEHWLKVFQDLLGFGSWLFHIDYNVVDEQDDVAASMVSWEYRNVHFIFDLTHSSWHQPNADVARVVAHEVFHAVTGPLYDLSLLYADGKVEKKIARKINESVVSGFERSPLVELVKAQFPYGP